jgi:hypothetical protein
MMRQRCYTARFTRGTDVRAFTVFAWNKGDAYVAALRELEAVVADARAWAYYGVERAR